MLITMEWLAAKESRQEKWCDTYSGKMVRQGCPKACDFCMELIMFEKTETPSVAPFTETPSMTPKILTTN